MSHLASDPGIRPSAAQSWPEHSMVTRPGQRTLEAARGNGYAPVMLHHTRDYDNDDRQLHIGNETKNNTAMHL